MKDCAGYFWVIRSSGLGEEIWLDIWDETFYSAKTGKDMAKHQRSESISQLLPVIFFCVLNILYDMIDHVVITWQLYS